jgi:hypothetical protein
MAADRALATARGQIPETAIRRGSALDLAARQFLDNVASARQRPGERVALE